MVALPQSKAGSSRLPIPNKELGAARPSITAPVASKTPALRPRSNSFGTPGPSPYKQLADIVPTPTRMLVRAMSCGNLSGRIAKFENFSKQESPKPSKKSGKPKNTG